MGPAAPNFFDMGSVVPHPVVGHIWVTLGAVKRGTSGKARELKTRKIQEKTEGYGRGVKSESAARMLLMRS
jgi:hypothetical protein